MENLVEKIQNLEDLRLFLEKGKTERISIVWLSKLYQKAFGKPLTGASCSSCMRNTLSNVEANIKVLKDQLKVQLTKEISDRKNEENDGTHNEKVVSPIEEEKSSPDNKVESFKKTPEELALMKEKIRMKKEIKKRQ